MPSYIRSSIILLMSFLCISNFGCRKNESNPVQPTPIVKPNKAVSFNTPKNGDVWLQNTYQKISWSVNKDSTSPTVQIEFQKGITQPFIPYSLAQWNSLQTMVYVTLDTSSFYRLRIRGNWTDWDTSGVFRVKENIYSVFSPRENDVLYVGDNIKIQLSVSVPTAISIDLSIDSQKSWQEIIKPNSSMFWNVQSQPSKECYLRVRDSNGNTLAISSRFEIINSENPNFKITSPKIGDILHQGTKISIKYINQAPKSTAFDFSSDDGNTWTQIIPTGNSPDWFIASDPSDNCKLRMRTSDTSLSYITGRFKIISDLDEFFPLKIGMVLHYEYHHWNLVNLQDSARYRYTIEINSSNTDHDTTVYACRVSYQNYYPNQDSSTVYSTFKEYNFGLHPISSSIAPFSLAPVYRYADSAVLEKSDSYADPYYMYGWFWTQKKGLGITSYGWWSGHELNSKGDSYTLL